MDTIYIRLLNEGVEVVRPTSAELLNSGLYKVHPTPNYDPQDEQWEFVPGSIVKVVKKTMADGELLVAVAADSSA